MPTRNQQMSRVAPFSQLLMGTGDPALTRIGAADVALQGSENRYGRGRGRPTVLGSEGLVYDEETGEWYQPEAYTRSRDLEHRRKMQQLEAMWGQRQATQEQKALRSTAEEQAGLDLIKRTLRDMEDLQAKGGDVGSVFGDSFAGILESWNADMPARWVERATYDEVEEELRPRLRLSFMSLFDKMMTGTPSDRDMQMMERLDPSARGLSMKNRIDNLKLAEQHVQSVLARKGAPGAVSPTAPGGGAQAPQRPEGVTDAEWQSWLIEQGML